MGHIAAWDIFRRTLVENIVLDQKDIWETFSETGSTSPESTSLQCIAVDCRSSECSM